MLTTAIRQRTHSVWAGLAKGPCSDVGVARISLGPDVWKQMSFVCAEQLVQEYHFSFVNARCGLLPCVQQCRAQFELVNRENPDRSQPPYTVRSLCFL